MKPQAFRLHGPAVPVVPLVLDSPHSGFRFPSDFDAVVGELDLRDGEDCFVDQLYLPATELGVPLPNEPARVLRRVDHRPPRDDRRDDGLPARCWPLAELARRLGGGPPPLEPLLKALRQQGFSAQASAVMPAQLRSDAPWERLLDVAAHVIRAGQVPGDLGAALNR